MAADVSARVHLVAEKLQQKAQEAQRKGNDTAARALSSSVSDLRQALALIAEQRHLLARRQGKGDNEPDDMEALGAHLSRVETMLSKKADDMKRKGREKAALALQEAAGVVNQGRRVLLEQQQTIYGLEGRWEKLQMMVDRGEKKQRCSSGGSSSRDEAEATRLFGRVGSLVQIEDVMAESFPACKTIQEVQQEVEKLKLEGTMARQEAEEAHERWKQKELALEDVNMEMERRKEREAVRQEEDAALLEQQREACQAMEQLVRESDQEIHRMTQSATTQAEEVQSLRIERESLTAEKERLVRAHRDEIEELQGQLASAMDALSTKMDKAEEVQMLQIQLDSVTLEKNNLVKARADEVEELRRQLEHATASLSAIKAERAEANDDKLQASLTMVNALTAEKENLAKLHDNEVKELLKAHSHEIEDLRQKLECAVNDVTNTEANGEIGVGAVQAKTDYFISDKEDLAKSYADKLGAIQEAHRDEIDDLCRQLESAKKTGAQNAEELQSLRDKVQNLTLEKGNLAEIHDNELQKLREAYVAEIEDLRDQLEANTVHQAPRTKERTESTADELQHMRAEVGALIIEKDRLVKEHGAEINRLLHQVKGDKTGETGKPGDQQKSSINDYEYDGEQEENDDMPVMELEDDELQSADIVEEDEVDSSSNGASDSKSEDIGVSLVTQLNEMKSVLAAKSAEQKEAAKAIMLCKAELCACRSKLEAQDLECNQLKSGLEVAQHVEGEIVERLSKLTTELREFVIGVRSSIKMDGNAMRDFTSEEWQSPEVAELCSGLAPLLTDLMSAQDQIHTIEEQLKLMRSERDNEKLIVEQFVKTSDCRLFAKDGEQVDEVTEALDKNVLECLSVAKINIHRWLDELELLRARVEKDSVNLNALEHEKLQDQKRLVTLEDSERNLQVLVNSLREELITMRTENQEAVESLERLEAQNHSASNQEQQQQVAQQEEVTELQQKLATMRSDFDRYRARSHTALKKMEKRAELLNGMRKENEELLKQVMESDRQREQAIAAREVSESRLQEVQRTQEIMQAEFDEFAMEKSRVISTLEVEGKRLASEREQMGARIQELALKVQELEIKKEQIKAERERIQKAEQIAFQARLDTATAAVQTAKLDLQKVHEALEVSKAENEKRQKFIEFLELKLEKQSQAVTIDTTTTSPIEANAVIPAPVTYVSPLASPATEDKSHVAGLVKEVSVLRASGAVLRKQLDDAQAELIALQERFATTKAANAEKVFALEEQSNHWKMELAVVTEEVQRLNTIIEAQKKMAVHSPTNGTTISTIDPTKEAQATAARMDEIQELTAELAEANTEITLLTRTLDCCREELQEAQNQLVPLSSELENNEDSGVISKVTKVLDAREEALKKMRVQVFEMHEEIQMLREEKAVLEVKLEKGELNELQACRNHMQSEKVRVIELQKRQTLVSNFEKQVATMVDELQKRLEEHSSAFREVCDFRDKHCAFLFSDGDGVDGNASYGAGHAGNPEFEECLVMRSGVVIKAGASFQLPVFCEKSGWRVVWSFSVKEDGADVSFKLSAMTEDATITKTEIVSPERMNEMSGVLPVRHDDTTLMFEWDNSFSWLYEKTLDYHVSIQEPLTPQAQKIRQSERELQTKAKLLEDGLALLQVEVQRRSELSETLTRLDKCAATKEKHLAEFGTSKTKLLTLKTQFQEEMDAQKALFSAMLREQDELEDVERSITRTWQTAMAEREDVEMTLQLAGNGAQLEALAHKIEEQVQSVVKQLKTR